LVELTGTDIGYNFIEEITVLKAIYKKLYRRFGPQHWWPAEEPFEVIVGAILTQNTSWLNVEKAIGNLKENHLLKPAALFSLAPKKLASFIKPAGYFNIKANRLKEFLGYLFSHYGGNLRKMAATETVRLRQELLSVRGIGPETADSILLYALNKPIFVVDAYTRRILLRHHLIREDATYQNIQDLFMRQLPLDVKLFNEYHALLVKLGKEVCLKNKPKCKICPLR
jgi:endonuclease-3 related protein